MSPAFFEENSVNRLFMHDFKALHRLFLPAFAELDRKNLNNAPAKAEKIAGKALDNSEAE